MRRATSKQMAEAVARLNAALSEVAKHIVYSNGEWVRKCPKTCKDCNQEEE